MVTFKTIDYPDVVAERWIERLLNDTPPSRAREIIKSVDGLLKLAFKAGWYASREDQKARERE